MAIQTRQQANGRTNGLWWIAGVMVGTVALSAALVAGGLGWRQARALQTEAAAPLVGAQPVSLGITLPSGAQPGDLPAGLRDYLRADR